MHTFLADGWEKSHNVFFDTPVVQSIAKTLYDNLPVVLKEPCPFTPGKTVGDTHFLFFGLQSIAGKTLNLNRWAELSDSPDKHPRVTGNGKFDYSEEPFTVFPTRQALYLAPIVYPLTGMMYEDQLYRLRSGYEVASVIEAVSAQFAHYLKTRRYFPGLIFGRTRDKTLEGARIMLGEGDSDGVSLIQDRNNHMAPGVGLAVHRRFELKPLN